MSQYNITIKDLKNIYPDVRNIILYYHNEIYKYDEECKKIVKNNHYNLIDTINAFLFYFEINNDYMHGTKIYFPPTYLFIYGKCKKCPNTHDFKYNIISHKIFCSNCSFKKRCKILKKKIKRNNCLYR